jgi:GH15 family glucan-1,4-alpha-glucosidase
VQERSKANWRGFVSDLNLPSVLDATAVAFSKRALISLRTASAAAAGNSTAIVASVDNQTPYGFDWLRDGAFLNQARAQRAALSFCPHDSAYARRST